MTLESQVVSLSLAKKLKELGVKQDSQFWWSFEEHGATGWDVYFKNESLGPEEWFTLEKHVHISAFTVGELGEMLPAYLTETYRLPHGPWRVIHRADIHEDGEMYLEAETEADARAKMLIYLLENNLLPTPSMKVD
jgi:hypothetical protein